MIITSTNKHDKGIKTYLRKELKEYMGSFGHMTAEEKKDLQEWVEDGNSVYSNPGIISDDNGRPMDYVNACRFERVIYEQMMNPGAEQAPSGSETMDSEDDVPF